MLLKNSFKKLTLLVSAIALVLLSLAPLVPVAKAAGPNLISNPSVEDNSSGAPTNWTSSKTGTNNTTFVYSTTAHTGSRSLALNMTSRSSGNAKWVFTPVNVLPSTNYTFTDWYISNIQSRLQVIVTTTSGNTITLSTTTLSASTAWKQSSLSVRTPSNAKTITVYHLLNRVGQLTTDDYSFTANVSPSTPTVNLTAPVAGGALSGTQILKANATDSNGVANVQFSLNGSNLGAPDTTSPYELSWDTKTVANGTYTLGAKATNTQGTSALAPSVSVTVNNTSVTPPPPPITGNLIPNASLETSTNGTSPDGWTGSNWGSNTATFAHLTSGHTGSRSVQATISGYSSGAANWYYAPVAVTPGKTYKYENWYKSSVDTEVDAEVTMTDGSVQYLWLGSVPANTSWTKFSSDFVAPVGAKSLIIFQVLAKNGFVVTDDYSLSESIPVGMNRGIVSLTFDDGWRSIYTNGFPLLQKYGLASTQYLNSEPIMGGWSDYMTYQMVKDYYNAGHELGWHTQTHADLTTLSTTQMRQELTIPSAFLQGLGLPSSVFTNFATPYGAYNSNAINEIKNFYGSHRSTDVGYNSKNSLDLYNIKVQNITNTTTPAQVQAWVNQALNDKTWLVLVYHEVTASAADPTYAVTPANLDLELNYIKQSGISVQTVQQALNEIKGQL